MSYGAKVSQVGFSVETAADYQLVYSSDWPLLKLAFAGTVAIPDTSKDVVLKTHSLGFIPAFWAFDVSSAAHQINVSPGTSQFLGVTASSLTWFGASRGAGPGSITLRYYIFYQDIQTNYTAPIIQTSPASPGSSGNFGIKVSRPGKDISSTDLRDFSLHSDARSPLVHMVQSGATGGFPGWTVAIHHNLGYAPLFFIYVRLDAFLDGGWQLAATSDDALVTDGTADLTLGIPYSGSYAALIFKDPLKSV